MHCKDDLLSFEEWTTKYREEDEEDIEQEHVRLVAVIALTLAAFNGGNGFSVNRERVARMLDATARLLRENY